MKKTKVVGIVIFLLLSAGFLIPQKFSMPVEGASKSSYNSRSFWYYPWDKSITHKGVDVFAKSGKAVKSSTDGLVLFCGSINMGGNVILVLGPKWRLHYYAHLKDIKTSLFMWTDRNEIIGTVGTSGNAAGKQPHLHYSIITMVPYVWRIDNDRQGWKKMFYLNPIDYLEN